jgi:hypothetical protein
LVLINIKNTVGVGCNTGWDKVLYLYEVVLVPLKCFSYSKIFHDIIKNNIIKIGLSRKIICCTCTDMYKNTSTTAAIALAVVPQKLQRIPQKVFY